MLLYFFAAFCIVLASGYSDKESDTEKLSWADSYSVKATKVTLTSNIVEDFTAWKTRSSSRVDYNDGAVKIITKNFHKVHVKYQIQPVTTEEVLNKIVCKVLYRSRNKRTDLTEILPSVDDVEYKAVGNETVGEIYATKFEYNDIVGDRHKEEIRETIWAYYSDDQGWIPIKYDYKNYYIELGSLITHEIWTFFDYDPEFADNEVFFTNKYGCHNKSAVVHTEDSEEVTKELLFVDSDNEEHLHQVFEHFKNKYNRNYAHEREHALRKSIFIKNVRMITSVNRRNLTYKLGVNQFSDWTPEEIKMSHGAIPRPEGRVGTVAFPYDESNVLDIVEKLPKEYDMRLLGLISPVKDQGSCGSCWTFAAAAAIESGLARHNRGKVLSLSSQAMVDCAYEDLEVDDAGGCDGGFDYSAYEFTMKHGLPSDEEYGPYKNREGLCNIGNMTKTYRIVGYTDVTHNSPNSMKVAMVNHGALYVGIHASDEFTSYSSGIFYQSNEECDPGASDHAVVLVGYGERYGELFWILKNSYGESWGMNGYMLIAAKDNVCGVASSPSYPVF